MKASARKRGGTRGHYLSTFATRNIACGNIMFYIVNCNFAAITTRTSAFEAFYTKDRLGGNFNLLPKRKDEPKYIIYSGSRKYLQHSSWEFFMYRHIAAEDCVYICKKKFQTRRKNFRQFTKINPIPRYWQCFFRLFKLLRNNLLQHYKYFHLFAIIESR